MAVLDVVVKRCILHCDNGCDFLWGSCRHRLQGKGIVEQPLGNAGTWCIIGDLPMQLQVTSDGDSPTGGGVVRVEILVDYIFVING